ncbi:hypothetical protein GUITHDRAFT_154306 [Guillardia theta CCMP2712]|uniref:Protein kinase domain-containing protein n=1 Tax=Guillardia theta (strain CCMP2712) TaxID=905079 RepID=L1IVC7_GUITC|nr:hypothetical protein GUITHDRAFT_154306 [Guillardia theta CCMP2712]EKX39824.1 hypothetical protein GUITHDRAFT_154306 [Guillardia theta CCMP2712]|eukprot:XP_005826804.1 hypothetical protein GUITHDRAFT_154306 [Guillardia theta CCMP2712]
MDAGKRETMIIKGILRPILAALRDMHRVGIVHRDIKPANLIVTYEGTPPVKLIDLGAALVVPQEVPRAPPRFVALLLSPALWQLTSPDRFDTYSAGIMLMQMSIPELRTGKALDTFKSQLYNTGEDLIRWKEEFGSQYDLSLLERNGGAGWDLATKLVRPRNFFQRGRFSAREAMGHRYFWPEII